MSFLNNCHFFSNAAIYLFIYFYLSNIYIVTHVTRSDSSISIGVVYEMTIKCFMYHKISSFNGSKQMLRLFLRCGIFKSQYIIINILLLQVMDEKLIFVKVHAPWEVLCSYAEIMHIKLPLQPDDTKTPDSALTWISRFFNVDENIINPEQEFFTAAFENERISHFYIQDKDSFFNSAARSRIVSCRI